MISLNILEVKQFMAKLLTSESFDSLLTREVELHTGTVFKILGNIKEEFYTKEELEQREELGFVRWSEVRQTVYAMIKGNKTPLLLRIDFQLPKKQSEKLELQSMGSSKTEEVSAFFLQVRFEKGKLHIITGMARKTFTLDKTLEKEWDAEVKALLKSNGIIAEEEA